jgi:hypothetical protein
MLWRVITSIFGRKAKYVSNPAESKNNKKSHSNEIRINKSSDATAFTLSDIEFNIRSKLSELSGRARQMLQNQSQWGAAAFMVEIAASSCERIVDKVLQADPRTIPYDLLVEILAVSRHWFDAEYGDDDGYGGLCYSELISHIIAIQVSQESFAKYDSDKWREIRNSGQFSNSLIRFLNSPDAYSRVADYILQKDYVACFDLARFMEENTRRSDIWREALRLKIMISKRVGDEDGVNQILAQIQTMKSGGNEFDDFFDELASGQACISECGTDLSPFTRCRALFWEGSCRKSNGDSTGLALLEDAYLMDLDVLECVLAGADLGILWKDRISTPSLSKRSQYPLKSDPH